MTFDAQLLAARPSLLRYAKKLTRGNVAAAEDLLSTATVKMLSSSAAFAPGTNFMAWASTILRNSYFDYRRRLANRIIVDDIEQLPHLAVPPEVESRQRAADMLRAFIHLPPPMRSTLMRSVATGETLSVIAKDEGCAEGTIKSRISRARAILQKGERDAI